MAVRPKVLSISLNQDHSCFICCLENGFRIFSCDPLEERERYEFADGGIGQGEMLYRCNFLAFVGGGRSPKYPTNKVVIWDDRRKRAIVSLPFKSEVYESGIFELRTDKLLTRDFHITLQLRAVKLRKDRIIAVLDTKSVVFSFTEEPEQLHVFQTYPNPSGLCAVCPRADNPYLILPGMKQGQVQIINLHDTSRTGQIIDAHVGALACMALNQTGTMLATASEKGTLLRVFATRTSQQLYELRRGTTSVVISSLNFSHDSTKIVVSSDSATVHIFNLSDSDSSNIGANATYFNSTRSFVKFTVACAKPVCAFTPDGNSVIAICTDGTFYRCIFDSNWRTDIKIANYLAPLNVAQGP